MEQYCFSTTLTSQALFIEALSVVSVLHRIPTFLSESLLPSFFSAEASPVWLFRREDVQNAWGGGDDAFFVLHLLFLHFCCFSVGNLLLLLLEQKEERKKKKKKERVFDA